MLKPSLFKTLSYISLVCCILGILVTVYAAALSGHFMFYIIAFSWLLLAYSSYLGTKLAGYELYEEDMRRLGYYIYGTLILFVLFIFINLTIGIVPAAFIAFKLHNQKRILDEWARENKAQESSLE